MTEYNKRVLKNVLEDLLEENDELFLKEIEESKNNPFFANTEESDAKFQKVLKDCTKKGKRKTYTKTFMRVASIVIVLLICLSVATLSVKGFREKLWEILSNIGNSSYSSMISSHNENESLLADYEGLYIPKYIPDGYEITLVDTKAYFTSIEFKNSSGNKIYYSEYLKEYDVKVNLDKESFDSYINQSIKGKKSIIATKNGIVSLVIKEKDAVIHVVFDEPGINVIGFAELIEKK